MRVYITLPGWWGVEYHTCLVVYRLPYLAGEVYITLLGCRGCRLLYLAVGMYIILPGWWGVDYPTWQVRGAGSVAGGCQVHEPAASRIQ